MENNKKVLLGMSGGVDSSVAAILLKEQGYDVIGITMNLFHGKDNSYYEDAKKICEFLNIPHYTCDYSNLFNTCVITDFISEYKTCRTPNPCIECNKYLKFGAMFEKAKELDCNYIATGHYAKLEFDEKYGQVVLKKSNSIGKDQSYVLYSISKHLLSHILFPLNDFENKEQIREIARNHNLPIADKPDSEDICFIPNGDYKNFLENNSDISESPGNIVTSSGKILGKHSGLYKYTIGQRKGLGISYSSPLFVIGFNIEKNELIVGEEQELYRKDFYITNFNNLVNNFPENIEIDVKIRYAAKPAKAKLIFEDSKLHVILNEPQKSITPGQSAVFYDGNIVLGGGKIL